MDHVLDVVIGFINSAIGASATVAVVVEFALRLIPSDKPLSILYAVDGVFKMLGALIAKVGSVFSLAASFLDKIIQNVSPPAPPSA